MKANKLVLAIVVLAFLIGIFYYVPNQPQNREVVTDVDSLLFSFQHLLSGDTQGFVSSLVKGLPALAVFMIVFSLLHFILSGALKSLFGKKQYATTIALVVSLYTLADQRVYNLIINGNAFVIGLLVFCVLIILLWGLGKQGVASVKESNPSKQKDQFPTKKERVRALKKYLREH